MKSLSGKIEVLANFEDVISKKAVDSCKFACFLRNKMEKSGIKSLQEGKYFLEVQKGSYTDISFCMSIDSDCCSVSLESSELSVANETAYLGNDFNLTYNLPSLENIIEFANDADAILSELIELQNRRITFPSIEKTGE